MKLVFSLALVLFASPFAVAQDDKGKGGGAPGGGPGRAGGPGGAMREACKAEIEKCKKTAGEDRAKMRECMMNMKKEEMSEACKKVRDEMAKRRGERGDKK